MTFEETKKLGIEYKDLTGITEIIPNKLYKIRTSGENRIRKTVHGNLVKTINEKQHLIQKAEKELIDRPKQIKKVMESITFEEAVIRTIDYLEQLGENSDAIDLNTVFGYYDLIKMYVYDFFPKDSKLSSINENKIKEFITYMFSRKRKDETDFLVLGTVKKTYSALSWVIRYSSEIADPPLLKENYLKNIVFKTLIPKGRSKEKHYVNTHTVKELEQLTDVINKKANIRLKSMINLIIDVGCRDEECLGLKWENVDLQTGMISYQEAITASISKANSLKHSGTRTKELKSKNSYRNNFITKTTINYLTQLKSFKKALGLSVNGNDYIFTIWKDNTVLSPISFQSEYKRFRQKYGFSDFPIYDIRRTLSNILLESGISEKDVAKYMGNTPRTLMHSYANIREETEQKIQNIVKNTLRQNQKKDFNIDTIVYILNCNDAIGDNSDAYELLDFIANKKININEEYSAIDNTKKLILEQYPNFSIFCNPDCQTVKTKLETYKAFNNDCIEITQDPNYYLEKIKI